MILTKTLESFLGNLEDPTARTLVARLMGILESITEMTKTRLDDVLFDVLKPLVERACAGAGLDADVTSQVCDNLRLTD